MKRLIAYFVIVAAALLLFATCRQPTAPTPAALSGTAEENAAKLLDLLTQAQATGDFSKVNAQAAADDPSGRLSSVIGRYERAAAPRQVEEQKLALLLPEFGDTDGTPNPIYQNGDVLVTKGSGSGESDIMGQILVKGYGHAGILDLDVFEHTAKSDDPADAFAILSADIDYLTDPGPDAKGWSWALNYETYRDWVVNNDIITVLHRNTDADEAPNPDQVRGALRAIADLHSLTNYAFIDLRFNPISREDRWFWYCSKVPWRVYAYPDAAADDNTFSIENDEFYFGATNRWTVFRQSILYQVYEIYTWLHHLWWSRDRIDDAADLQLQKVLHGLITPDELRMSANLTPAFYVDRTVTSEGEPHTDFNHDMFIAGWEEYE